MILGSLNCLKIVFLSQFDNNNLFSIYNNQNKMNRTSKKGNQFKKVSQKSISASTTLRFKDTLNKQFAKVCYSSLLGDKKNSSIKKSKDKDCKSPKHSVTPKGVTTIMFKSPKTSLKQNLYRSTFNSKKHTPTSTPIQFQKNESQIEMKKKQKSDYKFIYQIGSGGFGSVWKVKQKRTNQIYAMKEISKAKVIMKKSVASVVNEKALLDQMSNPFIINAHESFQNRQYLYLAMEYLRGGDLRYHLCFQDFFTEEQTKFIVACIVLALQYIHSEQVIHRDLKPQNLVFEESGYLRLTDFGVARKKKANNSDETSGTPGYMAPEVICRMNHSYEADFFALGVIVYEIVMGQRPYLGQTRSEIRDKILAHQVKISQNDLPYSWSKDCADFINRLLKRGKESRLGYNGIDELKSHPWLKTINWKKMALKQIDPPFKPGIISESPQYQKQMQNTSVTEVDEETALLLRTSQIQTLFKHYDQIKKHELDLKKTLKR